MRDGKVAGMKQKRVLLTRKGGPEVLEIVEREVPEPGPGEARVRVLATGVAFADVMMRRGLYPGVPDFPWAALDRDRRLVHPSQRAASARPGGAERGHAIGRRVVRQCVGSWRDG